MGENISLTTATSKTTWSSTQNTDWALCSTSTATQLPIKSCFYLIKRAS